MTCQICNTDPGNVREYQCRLCEKPVGSYCETCWLERRLFEIVEANCRAGRSHMMEKGSKGKGRKP